MNFKTSAIILSSSAVIGLAVAFIFLKKTGPAPKPEICFNPAPQENTTPLCPYSEGLYLLPRTYPANGIFVGYSHNKEYGLFIQKILELVTLFEPPIKVNVLITRHEVGVARTALSPLINSPQGDHINVIPIPSDETLWAQDYMKVATNLETLRPNLIDLPYVEREGEVVPLSLSLTCRADLTDQAPFFATAEPGNGDYGGNIQAMPGDVVVVGNNITSETSALIDRNLPHQELFPLNVGWLETGHVDEIYSFTQPEAGSSCPLTVQHASPTLAITLLDRHKSWNQLLPYFQREVYDEEDRDRQVFKVCFEAAEGQRDLKTCQDLIAANRIYADIIKKDMLRLQKKLSEKTGCSSIRLVELPVLFSPTTLADKYGTDTDYATAVNPNLVNNILIGRHVILPAQANRSFQELAQKIFENDHLQTHFVESDMIHYGNGGLHCTSLVSRSCRQRPTP